MTQAHRIIVKLIDLLRAVSHLILNEIGHLFPDYGNNFLNLNYLNRRKFNKNE